LIAGKHDQLARSTPYAALAQAFGELVRQWLASPPSVLRAWQERIRSEVGDNARLIADVVPELDLLMGKLAPVPEVEGDQVLNRQKLTWLDFVRAVTTPNAPLVMFLDDMQWADTATLQIVKNIAVGKRPLQSLLVRDQHGVGDAVAPLQFHQDLLGVRELRNHVRANERGHLEPPQTSRPEHSDQADLLVRGDHLGLVLKAVARAHLPDPHALRHPAATVSLR